MADVTIQIETVDSTNSSVAGIISIYTLSYGLVARTPTQGTVAFTLDNSQSYVVSVTASNILFDNTTISPTEVQYLGCKVLPIRYLPHHKQIYVLFMVMFIK